MGCRIDIEVDQRLQIIPGIRSGFVEIRGLVHQYIEDLLMPFVESLQWHALGRNY